MLALNAMVHEPHGFSASMVATGREPTLPPDFEGDACASPALEDPASYVEAVKKRLTLTHQQMTPPPAPVATNPYHEGSLIFAMTTPSERTNKLAPQWKGPFVVKRVPNPYQVTYEDGLVWRTIHVNHAKPAKTPATGFPTPLPPPEPPKPTLGYLPRNLQRPLSRRPLPPPQPAAPTAGPPQPAAAPPATMPPSSRRPACTAANRNSAPRAVQQPPPAPGRANDNSRPGQQLRRSAHLTPRACAIKNPPQPAAAQLRSNPKMARTYPLSLDYNQYLGSKEDPYSFLSILLDDLHSGHQEYLVTVQQLIDALPKSLDTTTRFALRGQVTPTGYQRLRHSMRATLWWLLPSDGEFRRSPNGIQYYPARQGRRVVLRGGDVTHPLYESCMRWIPDPAPSPPRRAGQEFPVPISDSLAPIPSDSVRSCDVSVTVRRTSDTQASAITTSVPSGAPLTPSLPKKCRRRRQARRAANQNRAPSSAAPVTPDERWANRNAGSPGATQPLLEDSDPTSMMRTAVYPGLTQPPISTAIENSAFPLGLEPGKFPGLYKSAVPNPRQDSTARPFRVNNSGLSLSSPPHLQPYSKPFSGRPARPFMTCPTREAGGALRQRSGIVYPLLPPAQRPDTNIVIDAALPEAAAVGRQDLPPTVVEIGTTSQPQTEPSSRRRASRKPSRKRRRNLSAGVFRQPKRSPPQVHWCD